MQRMGAPYPLQFGLPALDAFPTDLLARLAARRWRPTSARREACAAPRSRR